MDDIVGHQASDTNLFSMDDDVDVDETPFNFFKGSDDGESDDGFNDIDLLVNKKRLPSEPSQEDEPDDPPPPSSNYFSVSRPQEDDDDPFPSKPTHNFASMADDISLSSEHTSPPTKPAAPPQTFEEIQKEKQTLLFKIKRLAQRGYKPERQFTMSSNIDDIRLEYKRLRHEKDLQGSIEFQRTMLTAFTGGVEKLNHNFDPFGIHLDGWSESVYDEIDRYDDVFEELHDKYAEKVQMAPELKLLMMLGGSAFMHHMFAKAMPDMRDVLKQNPDLARHFAQASMSHMANTGAVDPRSPMFQMAQQGVDMHTRPSRPPPQAESIDDLINEMNSTAPPPPRGSAPKKGGARRRKAKDSSLNIEF